VPVFSQTLCGIFSRPDDGQGLKGLGRESPGESDDKRGPGDGGPRGCRVLGWRDDG
jgi:hypothetical protein